MIHVEHNKSQALHFRFFKPSGKLALCVTVTVSLASFKYENSENSFHLVKWSIVKLHLSPAETDSDERESICCWDPCSITCPTHTLTPERLRLSICTDVSADGEIYEEAREEFSCVWGAEKHVRAFFLHLQQVLWCMQKCRNRYCHNQKLQE